MYKKAQNIIEIALLASVIVVVAISVIAIYNNQKMEMADLSKVNVNKQTVDLSTASSGKLQENAPYKPIETAGAMSNLLSSLGMTMDEFNSKMSEITYDDLKKATEQENDIVTMANKLIDDLKIDISKIGKDKVDVNTLRSLAEVASKASEQPNNADAKAFLDKFQELLK